MFWNDGLASYSVREIMEWGFKIVFNINYHYSIEKEVGENELVLLQSFINKVNFTFFWGSLCNCRKHFLFCLKTYITVRIILCFLSLLSSGFRQSLE